MHSFVITAHTKSSQSVPTRRLLVKDPNNVLCLRPYWLPNVSLTDSQAGGYLTPTSYFSD
jgi:hypothetical protein